MGANLNHAAEQLAAADILDSRRLKENYADDMELLEEVIELFFDSSPSYLSNIRDAVARGDSQALRETAHKLRGAVGNLCATATLEAARRLEEIGRDNRMAEAGDALIAVELELARLETALAEFVHPNDPGRTGAQG